MKAFFFAGVLALQVRNAGSAVAIIAVQGVVLHFGGK